MKISCQLSLVVIVVIHYEEMCDCAMTQNIYFNIVHRDS